MRSWIPRDTTAEAMRRQVEVLRRIGPAGRAAMTFELSDNVRSMVEAGVRGRHPDWEYLGRWAKELGVADALDRLRRAAADAAEPSR